MRIQKYLAACGVASRRQAEALVSAGRVKVNGIVVTQPGFPIAPDTDLVEVDSLQVRPAVLRHILLHKRVMTVCTRSDPDGRETIYPSLPADLHHLPYVGRLDYFSEGVLFLTNDGELAYRLTRPEYGIERVYEICIRGRLGTAEIERLERGIEDRGELLAAHKVRLVRIEGGVQFVSMVLKEGRNREIRRMFEQLDIPIVRLVRVGYAGIELGDLQPGAWRTLSDEEVSHLRKLVALEGGR